MWYNINIACIRRRLIVSSHITQYNIINCGGSRAVLAASSMLPTDFIYEGLMDTLLFGNPSRAIIIRKTNPRWNFSGLNPTTTLLCFRAHCTLSHGVKELISLNKKRKFTPHKLILDNKRTAKTPKYIAVAFNDYFESTF